MRVYVFKRTKYGEDILIDEFQNIDPPEALMKVHHGNPIYANGEWQIHTEKGEIFFAVVE